MNLNDEALVRSFLATKESKYFHELVARYQHRIYNASFRMLGNNEESEEVVQETFLKVLQGMDKFEGRCAFAGWLFTVSHNVCMDTMRRRKRAKAAQAYPYGYPSNLNTSVAETPANSQIADPEPGPPHQLERLEEQTKIEIALNELPESQRAVLVLHDVEGFSYQQIAEITGTNLGTVRSRLHYGRLKMREMLAPYFHKTALAPNSR